MEKTFKKITVIIPCHNEEDGIADVINDVPIRQLASLGFETEVIVIDNNSSDNTAAISQALKVRVISESKNGKGNAIRAGFNAISDDTDYVVMLDGDNTYKSGEIIRMIEPLESNFCDVIVGTRLGGKTKKNALRFRNRLANWMFTFLVRQFYKANVTDVLSGYFAWKKNVVDVLKNHLHSEDFSIEMEMITKIVKLGFEIYSVPITYDVRRGKTKLKAVKDGLKILQTFGKNLFLDDINMAGLKVKPNLNKPAAGGAKKTKIIIVSDAVYPFNKGGKEKRIYEIATRLAAQGHDITICCMKWWPGEKKIIKDGVKFQAISPYYQLYSGDRRSLRQAIFFALNCLRLFAVKFDIIEVDHIPHPALFAAKLVCLIKRKKMIVIWHEVWGKDYWRKYLGKIWFIAYLVEKSSVRLPDTIVSVSSHTTKRLQNILGRKKGIVTIPNGVDIKRIRNILPAKRVSDLVFAGRLLSHKNVDVLLRALGIIKKSRPDISLIIIGEGPEKVNLIKLAQKLGLEKNVSFLDFMDNDQEFFGILKASRIFVLPSTREGFGIVAVEANACGLPVITIDTEQNAAKDLIVADENGKLCALDEKMMADEILQLLINRRDQEYYVKYVRQYDWEIIISKVEDVYKL